MTVATPPRGPEAEQGRDLAQRVAELEALIEEARRRARRRRIRNVTASVLAAGAAGAALIGFHGGGGGGTGTAARADGSSANGKATTQTPPLAALPGGNGVSAFAFDPRQPKIVYVASAHARGGVYVYKTDDDGQHWLLTGAQGTGWISDILSLSADPRQPGILYAGTDTAVYKTVDSGRSWRPFNRGLFPRHGGRVCYRGPAGRVCVKYPYGTPGTTSWNRNNGWVLDVAVDPARSSVLYSAADAVRKSTDGGHTWKTVLVPKRWRYHFVTRLAIAPTHPESIYAIAHNLHNGATAIYKSTDAGRSWQVTGGRDSSLPPSCCGDSEDALAVDPQNPRKLYAVVGGTVFRTADGGASWQPTTGGLPARHVTSLAADPQRTNTLYASVEIPHTYTTPAGDVEQPTGAVYKTTDGGEMWSEVFSGFGIEKVAVEPARSSTVYAAGWAGRDPTHSNAFRIVRTTDGGHTWTVGR